VIYEAKRVRSDGSRHADGDGQNRRDAMVLIGLPWAPRKSETYRDKNVIMTRATSFGSWRVKECRPACNDKRVPGVTRAIEAASCAAPS
jgi:hypothetical protein